MKHLTWRLTNDRKNHQRSIKSISFSVFSFHFNPDFLRGSQNDNDSHFLVIYIRRKGQGGKYKVGNL
jgi:hypothetical protein